MKVLQFTRKHHAAEPEDQFLICPDCDSHGDWAAVASEDLTVTKIICVSAKCDGKSYFEVEAGKIV